MFIIKEWNQMNNKLWLIIPLLFLIFSFPTYAQDGYSTLPGWSAGYRFYLDLDDEHKSKLRLFGKFKQRSGDTIRFGWERQTGRSLNFFRSGTINGQDWDNRGVIFFEQEFKF